MAVRRSATGNFKPSISVRATIELIVSAHNSPQRPAVLRYAKARLVKRRQRGRPGTYRLADPAALEM